MPDLSDYVTVAQRIAQFRDKYPTGTLQPLDLSKPYDVLQIGDRVMLVVVAAAYRSPEDPFPGVGMAAEPFPGATPYTRDSELMNAETSAWGRAIVAALAADTSLAIASAEEVRNRREDGLPTNRDGSLARSQLTDEQRDQAGVMTSGQAREHGQLRKLDHPRPAERSASPAEGDPWTDQPAGQWDGVTPEDKPGTSDERQWRQLGILYGQLGMTDEQRYEDLTNHVGRVVRSSKDLSYQEAEDAKRAVAALVRKRKAEA